MKIKYAREKDPQIDLTSGQEYEVIAIEHGWYRIITDLGDESGYFPPELFEITDETDMASLTLPQRKPAKFNIEDFI